MNPLLWDLSLWEERGNLGSQKRQRERGEEVNLDGAIVAIVLAVDAR